MVLGSAGGVSVLATSSSAMPFLNALMPWATSPISSEIFPRPNSSSTTAMTMIQCQILREPIGFILRTDGAKTVTRLRFFKENLGFARAKNKGFGRRDIAAGAAHDHRQKRQTAACDQGVEIRVNRNLIPCPRACQLGPRRARRAPPPGAGRGQGRDRPARAGPRPRAAPDRRTASAPG